MTTPSPDKIEIPEAAVEAMCDVASRVWGLPIGRQEALDLIASTLPHVPDRGYAEVGVRPLEWALEEASSFGAPSLVGKYVIGEDDKHHKGWQWGLIGDPREWVVSAFFATPDEAKAAAQADYEARIRSALIAQPAPVDRGYAEGIEAAAKSIDKRLHDYVEEHGSYDPDTGATEFPGNGDEYCAELEEIAEAIRALAPPAAADNGEPPLTIVYTNWRGETAERAIIPLRMWFGSTEWHKEPQWLLTALDVEKKAERDFAWAGIDFQGDGPVTPSPIEDVAGPSEEVLVKALERIERWFGEFPETGEVWPDGSPISYAAQWGSNGERDFMREIARTALAARRVRPSPSNSGDTP